tara:strand:- start:598 stop:1257 length:660 start_codon:yes stop_codon:yes gene_type:complete
MKVLVFDTETTGIIKDTMTDLNDYPNIVQLSYIVYDTIKKNIVECCDFIINHKNKFKIPEESTKVHGITNEISLKQGVSIKKALKSLLDSLNDVNYLVAHNLNFDKKMIEVELSRLGLDGPKMINKIIYNLEDFCTMNKSRSICKIDTGRKNTLGRTIYKNPKQSELHKHLFGTTPVNLHNSLNDVLVCLRCFIMLQFKRDVCDYSEELKLMLKSKVNI